MPQVLLQLLVMSASTWHVKAQGAPGGAGGFFVPSSSTGGRVCDKEDDDCHTAVAVLGLFAIVFVCLCAYRRKSLTLEDPPDAATYVSEGATASAAVWPSGTWRGYYKKCGSRSQTLCDFGLNFLAATQTQRENGSSTQPELSGSGVDTVGQFNIAGVYGNGRVAFQKRYIRDSQAANGRVNKHMNKGHSVEYRGEVVAGNFGQGIKGTWHIATSSSGYRGKGAFHLWPAMADWNRLHTSAPPAADAPSRRDEPTQFDVTSDNVCIVCAKRPINVCLRPCNHIAVCGQCADQLRPSLCPICRGQVSSISRQSQRRSHQQLTLLATQPSVTNPMGESDELASPHGIVTNV